MMTIIRFIMNDVRASVDLIEISITGFSKVSIELVNWVKEQLKNSSTFLCCLLFIYSIN